MTVVSLDPPDFRGQDVYRIEFDLQTKSGMERGMIHRSEEDFVKFNTMLHLRWVFVGDVELPETPSIEGYRDYLQLLTDHHAVMKSTLLQDFLGINWSGSDLKFFASLFDFFKVVIPPLYRAPDFAPEPPVFANEIDSITAPETPFEVYVYLEAFRAVGHLNEYETFFN